MPATVTPLEVTQIILDYRTRYYEINHNWAQSTYNFLNTYNYNGTGAMPDFAYNIPDGSGDSIQYTNGDGEIKINGTLFSSLNWESKIKFFKWQRQFIKRGIVEYSHTYNI